MLKHRIIPTLLYKDFGLVKGEKFNSWRRIGTAEQVVKIFEIRKVDELVFVDITATQQGRTPDYVLIEKLSRECFMPIAIGGGVNSLECIEKILKFGADKVVINTHAVRNPEIIREASEVFGSQSIIASIDYSYVNGSPFVKCKSGRELTSLDPVETAVRLQDFGAGEILLCNIDRDGTYCGYDLELLKKTSQLLDIPIIASGGCGNYEDMAQALNYAKVDAVSASSIFQFTEKTPMEAKLYLHERDVPVRL